MSEGIARVNAAAGAATGAAHIPPATSDASAAARGASAAPADARTTKLRKAAADFESLLVKQMLKEAKIGGPEMSNGYGDMAIDALASAIEKGGGLGLSKCIERAIHPDTTHAAKSGASAAEPTATPEGATPTARVRTHKR